MSITMFGKSARRIYTELGDSGPLGHQVRQSLPPGRERSRNIRASSEGEIKVLLEMQLSGSCIAIGQSFVAHRRNLWPILKMSNGGNLQVADGLEWMQRSMDYIHALISVLGVLASSGPEICGDTYIECGEIYGIIRIVFNPCARALWHEQRLSPHNSLSFSKE